MVVIGEAFMMRNGTQMKVFDTNLSPDSNGAFKINLIKIIVAHFLLFVSFILQLRQPQFCMTLYQADVELVVATN